MNKKTVIFIILTIILIILGVVSTVQLLKAILTLIAELFFISILGGV